MNKQRVAELKGDRPKKRGGTGKHRTGAGVPGAQQHVQAQAGPVEMTNGERLQHPVIKSGPEPEEQQIRRVEKTGLNITDKRGTSIKGGIPKRQRTLLQLRGCKTISGEEKTDQITAIRRLIDLATECTPKKADR